MVLLAASEAEKEALQTCIDCASLPMMIAIEYSGVE